MYNWTDTAIFTTAAARQTAEEDLTESCFVVRAGRRRAAFRGRYRSATASAGWCRRERRSRWHRSPDGHGRGPRWTRLRGCDRLRARCTDSRRAATSRPRRQSTSQHSEGTRLFQAVVSAYKSFITLLLTNELFSKISKSYLSCRFGLLLWELCRYRALLLTVPYIPLYYIENYYWPA